jgi:hypothetical protein
MGTTPIKDHTAAREKSAQRGRTVANELPQELSRLPGQYGFSDENSCLQGVKSAAHGGGRGIAGRPRKGAAIPKARQRAIITTTGFTDDGHPTIMAGTRG